MTVNANYSGNVEKSVHAVLSATTATAVGSAALDNSKTLSGWSFANTSAGAIVCKMIHTQGGTDYTVWVKSVAADDTAVESNVPVRLLTGDSVKVVGDTGITVTLTYTANYPLGGQ